MRGWRDEFGGLRRVVGVFLLRLHFCLKASRCGMVGVELQGGLNFDARIEEQAFLEKFFSASDDLPNSRFSLIFSQRGLQVIQERLYGGVLVIDEKRLEEETASFGR